MTAGIVYEGVGGGGELFKDMKFFLLQRVPSRQHYKNLIEANGGEITQLEKLADIIIADHARKDQPEGSISWTFIEASVKNGQLEDIEDHPAGPVTRAVRQVGSTQPTRKGRTPFTPEDDRILMNWCAKAERKGFSLKGNEIYQQLEAKNSRHTYQSWRDRWIKHVSIRPRPKATEEDNKEDEEEDDESGPIRRPVPEAPKPQPIARPKRGPAAPPTALIRAPAKRAQSSSARSTPIPRSPASHPFVQRSAGGNVFSDAETQELLDHYDEIINLSDDRIIDAWIAWAFEYPNHTAQEWRNYFIEYIVPTVTAEDESERKSKKSEKRPERSEAPAKARHVIQTIPGPSAPKSNGQTLEVKDSQGSSGQILESPKLEKIAVDPSTIDEAIFKEHLLVLAESLGQEVNNFEPEICGRRIPLFRLWQVVESDEFGGYDEVEGKRLWRKVATRLNFSEFRHPNAADELRDCFSEILVDLDQIMNESQEDESLTESQEKTLIENQLRQTAARKGQSVQDAEAPEEEEEEEDDNLDFPQSTPQQSYSPRGKRSFDGSHQDSFSNKRPRIDKGKGKELEIPSTPEDLINSNQIIRPPVQPSPLKYSSAQPEEEDEDDEDDISVSGGLYIRPPSFHRAVSSALDQALAVRTLEPETQDFHFPPEQDEDNHTAPADLTPSPVRSSSKLPDRSKTSHAATHGAVHSSSKNEDSSTQSQTESQSKAELNEFIERFESLGYPRDVITEALEATTMVLADTGPVIEQLMQGNGIPDNMPGVWTRDDDEALYKRKDSSEFEKIVTKHGILPCSKRKKFLMRIREAARKVQEIEQRNLESDGQGADEAEVEP